MKFSAFIFALVFGCCVVMADVQKWEYATFSSYELTVMKEGSAAWKEPGKDAVIVSKQVSAEAAEWKVLLKITNATPPSGFAGCTTAGLLNYAASQGWEFVSVSAQPTATGPTREYIFRRQAK